MLNRILRKTLIAAFVLTLAAAVPAMGQASASRGALRVTVGYGMQYLDEPWRTAIGGSVRFQVFRRFSVEPEFVSSRGPRFNQWTFIPNVVVDLRDPKEKVIPYVIGGVGYFRDLDKSINYKRSEIGWSGGFGARVRLGGGLFVSPEFRLGHITRAAVGIGYQF